MRDPLPRKSVVARSALCALLLSVCGGMAHAETPTFSSEGGTWTLLYTQVGGTNAPTALSADGATLFWGEYLNGAASGVYRRRVDGVVSRLSSLNYPAGMLPLANGDLLWARI